MSEYFPVEPLGSDSAYVECFSSYCCRLAAAHTLSPGTLIRHLQTWWRKTTGDDSVLKSSRGISLIWNNYSPTACELRRIVGQATSVRGLDRTSLAALAPAAPVNGLGLLRKTRAWCPACMAEVRSDEQHYDRLLWVLPNVVRCPEHQLRLMEACGNCGCAQKYYHASGDLTRCWKCSGTLVVSHRLWTYEPNPSLCEVGVIELIRMIGSSSLVSKEGAFQIFAREIRSSLPGKRRSYGYIFGSSCYKHVRRERMAPTFSSMLQQSQALGVSLVHILSDPTGAAKVAGELALSGHISDSKRVARISKQALKAIQKRLTEALADPCNIEETSFKSLSKEFNALPGTVEYHFRELAIRYKAMRKELLAKKREDQERLLHLALDGGLIDDYRSRSIRSIDELARLANDASDCGIGVARRVISEKLNAML